MLRADAVSAAESILGYVQHYATVGVVVALAFLVFGVGRISPEARGSYLFRLLVLPGVIGLWPLVAWRWFTLERDRRAGGGEA
jgi:hypothetical protein